MIRSAFLTDKAALAALWRMCFGDDDTSIDRFFDSLFQPENCMTMWEGETLVGMLFLLPAKLHFKLWDYSCGYIYAAATRKEYRCRGVLRALEQAACERAERLSIDLLALVPQGASLFSLYERLGYTTASYQWESILALPPSAQGCLSVCPREDFLTLRRRYLSQKDCYIDLQPIGQAYRFIDQNDGGQLWLYTDAGESGYLVGRQTGRVYTLEETDLPALQASRAACLIQQRLYGVKQVVSLNLAGRRLPYGMIKVLSGLLSARELVQASPYMNLMLL